jgi:group II intron reverse transcriptase/maturase
MHFSIGVFNMDVERLEKISVQAKRDPDKIWNNLHRLLCSEKLWITSYEKQKSNAGALTPAMDSKDTMQGMSLDKIRKTIQSLKNDSWKPEISRQIHIPKPGRKETRPLGIQGGMDKLLQGVVLLILEAIYEPTFLPHSYGFRPGIGTHDALQYIDRTFKGTRFALEGDIQACYPTIHHSKLILILSKRIKDNRFLNVIQKMLKAGVWDIGTNKLAYQKVGTPQGSIVSPILANIYLHEMDLFIEKWYRDNIIPIYRTTPKLSNTSAAVQSKIQYLQKIKSPDIKEIRKLKVQKLGMVSIAPESIAPRLIYVRYADDFLIGTNLDHHKVVKLKSDLTEFLKDTLALTLSQEKSKIADLKKSSILFLGFNIKISSSQKISLITSIAKSPYLKRTTGHFVRLEIPILKVIANLSQKGICDKEGYPISITRLTAFDDLDIIRYGSALLRGILIYYAPTKSTAHKHRIHYIIKYSLLHTLSHKYKSSVKKMFSKYPDNLTVKYEHKDMKGKVWPKQVKLDKVDPTVKWRLGEKLNIYDTYLRKYTKSRLGKNCAMCESTIQIEMHHINSLKNIRPNTFDELHGYVNRLQIPLCNKCHNQVTKGKYDGLPIRSLLLAFPNDGKDLRKEL